MSRVMDEVVLDSYEKTLETGDVDKIRFHYDRDVRQYLYIDDDVRSVAETVKIACENILGMGWNHYSNALRPEVCSGFATVIRDVMSRNRMYIRYLEIGSNQGVSMAFISEFIKINKIASLLVSVDPYYEEGYLEGEGNPLNKYDNAVAITKTTKEDAFRLYSYLKTPVQLLEMRSREALQKLFTHQEMFDVIYIDGSHQGLNPMVDTVLAQCIIKPGGVIILDDWYWDDVLPIKKLLDLHAVKFYECWKIAAYKF